MQTIHDVPIILRREIEALYIAPFLDAFAKELGWEKTKEIAVDVIHNIAAQAGADAAARAGGNSLEIFLEKVNPGFAAGGALESTAQIDENGVLCIDMTRCKYAEMYERLGMKELGAMLSCERDGYLFTGFNPNFEFKRTQTIMSGCPGCDFRVTNKEKK